MTLTTNLVTPQEFVPCARTTECMRFYNSRKPVIYKLEHALILDCISYCLQHSPLK